MATSRGAEDGDVEVGRVGSLVVESLLMMGIDDQEGSKNALKVHVQVTDAKTGYFKRCVCESMKKLAV